MERIFKVTIERCTACGKCELACAFAHGTPGAPGPSRIHVTRTGLEAGVPIVCLQCDEAACVAVCPSGALTRNESTGAIELDEQKCLGCRACVAACPFGCMEWHKERRKAYKCDLCGGAPACVAHCPTSALEYLEEGSAHEVSTVRRRGDGARAGEGGHEDAQAL